MASTLEEIAELVELCSSGRLYEVERWIAAGKPIQAFDPVNQWRRPDTPARVAFLQQNYSLLLLLLVNGYRLPDDPSLLGEVIEGKAWEYVGLLLAWGADRAAVAPEIVFGSYDGDLIEQFWSAGLRFTPADMGRALATGNKPLCGFARRYRSRDERVQTALDLALGHAIEKQKARATALCLWAGANPHRRLKDLDSADEPPTSYDDELIKSAVERAVHYAESAVVARLKPNPSDDDFQRLYEWIEDPATIGVLAVIALPSDWSRVLVRHIQRFAWGFRTWQAKERLDQLFALGGSLTDLGKTKAKDLRREILKMPNSDFCQLMRLLGKPLHCSPAIYAELCASPRMRERLSETRVSQAALQPVKRRTVSPTQYLIAKDDLKRMVWEEPTQVIAKRFGVSDVAIGKWCRAYGIKKPPRGYWAKQGRPNHPL
jgi:hypothetical protein